jgi:hypothetical protein
MAVDHVKSASIINSDASPAVSNTAGEGGSAPLKHISGIAVGVASSSIDATYQFVRVPSTAKIKGMWFGTTTQAAGAMDIGVYYATDGIIGKPTALLAAAAIDQDFFASALVLTTTTMQEAMLESGVYTPDKWNMPLWQALGLTADPGGNFDICGTLTTAITTGTGKMGLNVTYTD